MKVVYIQNNDNIKSIINGTQTCIRKLIKNKYENTDIDFFENKYGKRICYIQNDVPAPTINSDGSTTHTLIAMEEVQKPYNKGEIIGLKEEWKIDSFDKNKKEIVFAYKNTIDKKSFIFSDLNKYEKIIKNFNDNNWESSFYMPKEAIRIFIQIIDIQAKKIFDLNYEDYLKEGFIGENEKLIKDKYKNYWDSQIKEDEYKYKNNPWIFEIHFKYLKEQKIQIK